MRNLSLSFFRILVLACLMQSTVVSFVFRLGAVLSSHGKTGEMRDARNGYELFFNLASNGHMYPDFMLLGKNGTTRFNMTYVFLSRDDNSDKGEHGEELDELVEHQNLTFLLGSHPKYAKKEMEISNDKELINFQCCVGPDSFYRQGYKKVFGIHVSNRRYVKSTMIKLSLENVKRLWIIVDESDDFTKTTCEAALHVETFEGNVSENMKEFEYLRFNGSSFNESFFKDFANNAKKKGVEAVIACVLKPDGKKLVHAFHDIKYPLKAFFLTAGPASQEWVDSIANESRSDSLLSAAQWHKEMLYEDEFFGNGSQYVEKHMEKYEEEPSYVSASASATGLILHYAIKKAFQRCDLALTNGDLHQLLRNATAIRCGNNDGGDITGYERVIEALQKTNKKIFFGKVKFNRFRRNVGNTPVTTQVLHSNEDDIGQNDSSPIKAVLPLNHATTNQFRFPAKPYHEKECKPGEYINDTFFYNRCRPCKRGSVSFRFNATDCDSCSFGKYTDKEGQDKCKECLPGTNTSQIGSTGRRDCICEKGYYNPSSKRGEECKPCPRGATCIGGHSLPSPQEYFWMNESWPDTAYPCDPGSVCLEGFACRRGHIGRLCAECDSGYFSVNERCYKCPHCFVVVIACLAIMIVWYAINVTISRSVASLQMLLDWAQLANIIGDINLNWPSGLMKLFGIASVLDFDVDILEPSCIVNKWSFRENLVVQLCLPLVITLVAMVRYLLSKLIFLLIKHNRVHLHENKRKLLSWFVQIPNSREDVSRNWDCVVGTFFSFVDVTYITIAKYCLDAFECQDIAGEKVLRSSPSVLCDTSQHNELVAIGAIGFLVYVLGYVGYLTWTLFYLRKKEAFHKEKYIRRYGFFYQDFEVQCFLSPVFILIQKLLFAVILVFLDNPVFQIGALAMVIIASLMIHVSTTPYLDAKNDVLVTVLLLTLMFEAFGGLMLYNDNLSDKESLVLEWMIIATLLLLLLAFSVVFFFEMANKYYIYLVKVFQKDFIIKGKGSCDRPSCSFFAQETSEGCFEMAVHFDCPTNEEKQQTQLLELADTFKPWYVYKCMQNDSDFREDWYKLTSLFSGFISRHSSASYWSLRPSAKFWRRMVNQFPEIVDFLAVADEETARHFNDIAKRLYKDFVLANQVLPLPLMKLLNWRDRAPMAHWLSVASKEDKEFFLRTTGKMLATIGYQNISDSMLMKVQENGQDVFLKERIARRHLRRKQKRNMQLIASGASPLDNPSMGHASQNYSQELEIKKRRVMIAAIGRKIVSREESLENEEFRGESGASKKKEK